MDQIDFVTLGTAFAAVAVLWAFVPAWVLWTLAGIAAGVTFFVVAGPRIVRALDREPPAPGAKLGFVSAAAAFSVLGAIVGLVRGATSASQTIAHAGSSVFVAIIGIVPAMLESLKNPIVALFLGGALGLGHGYSMAATKATGAIGELKKQVATAQEDVRRTSRAVTVITADRDALTSRLRFMAERVAQLEAPKPPTAPVTVSTRRK